MLFVPTAAMAADKESGKYYFRFSGKPSSIVCTTTSNTLNPGLKVSWNLPPTTPVDSAVQVGASVVFEDLLMPASASGSSALDTDTTTWKSEKAFPYTVVHTMTPRMEGAGTSSITYDCVNGKGVNFRISNARPF